MFGVSIPCSTLGSCVLQPQRAGLASSRTDVEPFIRHEAARHPTMAKKPKPPTTEVGVEKAAHR